MEAASLQFFGEVAYSVSAWFMPMYSYQLQDDASRQIEFQRHDVGIIFMPWENVRVRLRATFIADADHGESIDEAFEALDLQLLLGI